MHGRVRTFWSQLTTAARFASGRFTLIIFSVRLRDRKLTFIDIGKASYIKHHCIIPFPILPSRKNLHATRLAEKMLNPSCIKTIFREIIFSRFQFKLRGWNKRKQKSLPRTVRTVALHNVRYVHFRRARHRPTVAVSFMLCHEVKCKNQNIKNTCINKSVSSRIGGLSDT
jgi:hypothetical protein